MKPEAFYREKLTACGVPEHMHDGVIRYLLHGLPPGSFLIAVLSNDLKGACDRADVANRVALYRYVKFLYNYVPLAAWGTPAHVTAWLAQWPQAKGDSR